MSEPEVYDQHCHPCKDKAEMLKVFDRCFELARAYVPFQQVEALFPPETALLMGTVFPELSRPYMPKQHR